jgi:serine/threonine protein kinase
MRVPRWLAISDSAFAWEREALELIREHLPDHEPWRAWSNFEFLDDEGRVNEVDALILTPQGLLLVEIKSRPGTLEGDAHSWTWTTDSRRRTDDNPLRPADRKAKRLASLIRKQDALARSKLRPPWVEPVIFLSKVRPPLKIDAATRTHVFLRGRPGHETDDGIVAALTGGLAGAFPSRTPIDANAARAIARAIEQSGIRPSLREKRVGDYELGLMLAEGEGWQDFAAEHVSLKVQRRVRIYPYAIAASSDARARLGRLAAREFQILEGVEHPGILRVLDFRETDRGPALIFEHDPSARRLDHLLRDQGQELTTERRLDLIRQIAETLHYAHEKRLYHRALAPDSVLVRDLEGGRPRIQIMNWQTAARTDSGAVTPHRTSGTSHIEDYVADPAKVYLAPETVKVLAAPGHTRTCSPSARSPTTSSPASRPPPRLWSCRRG